MTKQTIYRVSLLMLSTFVLWYMVISFIEWDMSWIQHIVDDKQMRYSFLVGFIIKILLDFWLWSYIKDKYFHTYVDADKKLEEENQEKLRKTFN